MMKKYMKLIYIIAMSALVLSMSGCDWFHKSDDPVRPAVSVTTENRLMVITSPVLKQDESYMIYRGDKVRVTGTTAKYYVAPLDFGDEPVTMNLLFADVLSEDVPFVITTADSDYAVVISYNPGGTTFRDVKTNYGDVVRSGGGMQKLRYNGLAVAGASVVASALDFDDSNETVILLEESSAAFTSSRNDIPIYEDTSFTWHADPYHRHEYFTDNSNKEYTEEEMMSEILPEARSHYQYYSDEDDDGEDESEVNGALTYRRSVIKAYVAHDIRYMSREWNFEGLISADGNSEHVAYYADNVMNEVAGELGAGFEGPYIFATIPVMHAAVNVEGEDEETENEAEEEEEYPDEEYYVEQVNGSAVSYREVNTTRIMTHTADEAYNNPVLHIVEPGTYRLKGTWLGQIWVDVEDSSDVTLILDGVNIICDVAPAIVFNRARESGTGYNESPFDVGDEMKQDTGAKIILADKSTNTIAGLNVHRIMTPERNNDDVDTIDGTDVYQQKQLYRMDGAIDSRVSLAIGAESNNGGGKLTVKSNTYGGLHSDKYMLLDGGTYTITAAGDGVSTSLGDDTVFTMNSGRLNVTSKMGNGIYSGSYIVLNNGALDVTAVKDSDALNATDAGPLKAVEDVFMSENVTYSHQSYLTVDEEWTGGDDIENGADDSVKTMTKQPVTVHDDSGGVLLRINYDTPVKDEDAGAREVPGSGNVFTLEHIANSFADVRLERTDQ